MKKNNESLNTDLKNQIKSEIMSIPSFDINPIEAMKDINTYNRELGEDETKEATSSGGAGQYSQPLFGKEMKEDKIKRGLSDNKTFEDLVNKNKRKGKDVRLVEKDLKRQLNQGIKVEMEHTDNKKIAREIAMDHLWEDSNYYDKLKKVEATEATSTASSGQYSTPAFVAKNSKNWRGGKKPIFPGGKFVKVKEKCKKFPYCNQGDIKALKLTENTIENVIKKIAKKYNLTESVVRTIIKNNFK